MNPIQRGELQPCTHDGRHKHGTRAAYRKDGCRCYPCMAAAAAYAADRNRVSFTSSRVASEPARAHVETLKKAGLGYSRIAELAGVDRHVLLDLMNGRDGNLPSRELLKRNFDRIMEVTADNRPYGRALVSSVGTRRRYQALGTLGWTQAVIAQALHRRESSVRQLLDNEWVREETRQAMTDLYEHLIIQAAPTGAAAEQARRAAARKGWLPPGAWFEIDLDDPAAEPDLENLRPEDRLEAVGAEKVTINDLWDMARTGMRIDEVAARAGVKRKSLERRLHRHGDKELLPLLVHGRVAVA